MSPVIKKTSTKKCALDVQVQALKKKTKCDVDEDLLKLSNMSSVKKRDPLPSTSRNPLVPPIAKPNDYEKDQEIFNYLEEDEDPEDDVEEEVEEDGSEVLEDEDGIDQLYGRNYHKERMVHIGNGIYCIRKISTMALSSSAFISHIARKLLDGVFKTESLLKCTLTGIAPRAQGKEKQQQQVEALNFRARNAIVNFAITNGMRKKLQPQSIKTIERSLSQRIGEIKRMEEKRKRFLEDKHKN